MKLRDLIDENRIVTADKWGNRFPATAEIMVMVRRVEELGHWRDRTWLQDVHRADPLLYEEGMAKAMVASARVSRALRDLHALIRREAERRKTPVTCDAAGAAQLPRLPRVRNGYQA
jgi:hypothetical protein